MSSTVADQEAFVTGPTGTRTGTKRRTGSEAEAQTVTLRPVVSAAAWLTWTATQTTRADGYLLRRNGGAPVALGPASSGQATDGPLPNGPVTWTLETVAGTWSSTRVSASATVSC